jgi:putative phosphoribosyl transferase
MTKAAATRRSAHQRVGPAPWMLSGPLFRDRFDAGRQLASQLEVDCSRDLVVLGLARGGIQVAAGIARVFEAPLDVVAVRKVRHPWQPEYAIGAVTPGDGVYLRDSDGLGATEVTQAVATAKRAADELDRKLHAMRPPIDVRGRTALIVDDGLATGATMIAAARWAKRAGAAWSIAAVPVAAAESAAAVRQEVDELLALYELTDLGAVGIWYETFPQVGDEHVIRLLSEFAARRTTAVAP